MFGPSGLRRSEEAFKSPKANKPQIILEGVPLIYERVWPVISAS